MSLPYLLSSLLFTYIHRQQGRTGGLSRLTPLFICFWAKLVVEEDRTPVSRLSQLTCLDLEVLFRRSNGHRVNCYPSTFFLSISIIFIFTRVFFLLVINWEIATVIDVYYIKVTFMWVIISWRHKFHFWIPWEKSFILMNY